MIPGNESAAAAPEAASIPAGETSDLARELAQSEKLKQSETRLQEDALGLSQGLQAALSLSSNAVTFETIMPVAYNVNDIRVLSFRMEVELSDENSADALREALPIFEKVTVATIEQLLDKKFYNDVLYVKEKLQKDIQTAFNKRIEGGGRVKKVKFSEFKIQ